MQGETYHDSFAGPVLLSGLDQGVGNDNNGIADKGEGGGEGDPFKEALLGVGDVVVGRLLDEVAQRIRGGQRLASRAERGGFCDISIRIRGDDAAQGKSGEEEGEHNDGVGILQDGDGLAQRVGMAPAGGGV